MLQQNTNTILTKMEQQSSYISPIRVSSFPFKTQYRRHDSIFPYAKILPQQGNGYE
jgi:hypothetical protein